MCLICYFHPPSAICLRKSALGATESKKKRVNCNNGTSFVRSFRTPARQGGTTTFLHGGLLTISEMNSLLSIVKYIVDIYEPIALRLLLDLWPTFADFKGLGDALRWTAALLTCQYHCCNSYFPQFSWIFWVLSRWKFTFLLNNPILLIHHSAHVNLSWITHSWKI